MREVIDLLIPYVKRHKRYFVLLNLTTVIGVVAQTFIPLQISGIVDAVIVKNDSSLLFSGLLIILGLGVLNMFMMMGQRFTSVKFSQDVMYDLRQDLYSELQFQELEFYSNETIGQIMARTIEETFVFRDLLTWGYRITVQIIFLFIASIIAMYSKSPYLSAIFIVVPGIILIITVASSSRNAKKFYHARYQYGELSELMAENLTGIKSVKAFGRESEQVQSFNVENQEFYEAYMETAKVRAFLIPGMIFLISLALVGLVLVGGNLVVTQAISNGDFIAFMLLVLQIAVPGRFIGFMGVIYQDSMAASKRLNEIFLAPEYISEKEDAVEMEGIRGEVKFDHVSFDYPQTPHTLHNVNFTLKPNEKIALLGPTGAGKSTLINLLPRFFDPTEGKILIDDVDIKHYTLKSLRRHIGIVHQEAFLFTLSIHDNIAFGRQSASREEVIAAAKAAQIHDDIDALEEGYDTIVGERGVTLSGGQRQRVTIARTLLQDPEILIFDDSVSAVDPETESRIQEALESAAKSRTTIIISQRPSSLHYVDRIVVMDEGKIVQIGNHTDLRDETGLYKQFLDAMESEVKFMDWDDSNTISEEA